MAVQFILGRSGTGKTRFCVSEIIESLLDRGADEPLVLLVPEQATYQAEHTILSDSRISGYSRLNVLSFNRLGFLLSGKNPACGDLSSAGRQMVIRRILRDNQSRLKVLGSCVNGGTIASQLSETISELIQYAQEPGDVEDFLRGIAPEEQGGFASLKFADIGLIFSEYMKFIEGRFSDSDVELNKARRAVADFPAGTRLWVDGFSGFGGSERMMLAELMRRAAETKIALCLDASRIDVKNAAIEDIEPTSLFYPTERTYAELCQIIGKCKLQRAEPIILDRPVRFSRCPSLGRIESRLFSSALGSCEPEKTSVDSGLHVVCAANARAEVRFAATEILRLVKEEGFRYRDIAVIASDIESYEHYVRAYFDDLGISFFIDKPKRLNRHPAVELICSALRIVSEGFSGSDIFAYLKTGLVPISGDQIDMLANYCTAFGISGGNWQSQRDWDFDDRAKPCFDQPLVNELTHKIRVPLVALALKLLAADGTEKRLSADEFTRLIFEFLDHLEVRRTISEWIEESAAADDWQSVNEHQQFYGRLVDVFDEFCRVFSGHPAGCGDFLSILESSFGQLTMAFIPPTLDQVLVGSIERSRHPDLKAVFLIGTTQKQFPLPVSCESLLTDEDRSLAERMDFELKPGTSGLLAERQYLAYIAFTRASEVLYICYPAADDKGSPTVRSEFVSELAELFEGLKEESAATYGTVCRQIGPAAVDTENQLAELLCSRLGKDADPQQDDRHNLSALLEDICGDMQLASVGDSVKAAINYDNIAKLDAGITDEIFGVQLKSSATKLETFAACPYRYFAKYVLKLRERQDFVFKPMDVGNFYHKALDRLLKKMIEQKRDFVTIAEVRMTALLNTVIAELLEGDTFVSNFAKRSKHNRFIIDSAIENLSDCVSGMREMIGAGEFRPKCSEVVFGTCGDIDAEYKLELSDGRTLLLSGRIDRIDTAEIDGRRLAVVFDYKRGAKDFSWSGFFNGLNLQLPIYMLAAEKQGYQKAAGAFYLPIEIDSVKTKLTELAKQSEKFDYKAKGIFNGEIAGLLDEQACKDSKFYNFYVTKDGQPYGHYNKRGVLKPDDFEKVLKFTEEKIISLADSIVSGTIGIRPYRLNAKSPCEYCEYKALCRFDWRINEYRHLKSYDKNQAISSIGGADV